MSDGLTRIDYTAPNGERRWILAPDGSSGHPGVDAARAEALRLAQQQGKNVILLDFAALEDYVAVTRNEDLTDPILVDNARAEIFSTMFQNIPEFMDAADFSTDAANIHAGQLGIMTNRQQGNAPYVMTINPDTLVLYTGQAGRVSANELFRQTAGLPEGSVQNIRGSAEQYTNFILRHEIDHIEREGEIHSTAGRMREERNADLNTMRELSISSAFNSNNGLQEEIRAMRAMGVLNVNLLDSRGRVVASPYILTGAFNADGSIRQDNQFQDDRMVTAFQNAMTTVYAAHSLSLIEQEKRPQFADEWRETLQKAVMPDSAGNMLDTQAVYFGHMLLHETEMPNRTPSLAAAKGMYETVFVLNEAGAFARSPEAQAVMTDYLQAMQRYSTVPEQADLNAARQRLGFIVDNPDFVRATSGFNRLPDAPAPTITATATP